MDRRKLLGAAGLGFLMPLFPARRHVMSLQDGERCANPFVSSTLDWATSGGKPTLVLVVSADPVELWTRQNLFGHFLNYCSEEALLDLSLCEVLCASQADLAVHVPEVAELVDPLMILVGPGGSLRSAKDELPEASRHRGRGRNPEDEFNLSVLKRVAALEKTLNKLVVPNPESVSSYAAYAKEKLDPDRLEQVQAAGRSGSPLDPRLADEAAAVVRELFEGREEQGGLSASLREGTKRRLREGPPFGAHWRRATSCGSDIEKIAPGHAAAGSEPVSELFLMACGIGHTPKISKRFLSFWRAAAGD